MRIFLLSVLTVVMIALPIKVTQAKEAPVSKVILSTGGLAHFEHIATVEGNDSLQMPVRQNQVDDLLKSLVVFDTNGRVGSVTLPGKQPLTQVFRDLPFSKSDMNSPILLMNAYQGADVTLTGKSVVTGQLLRIVPKVVMLDNGKQITQEHQISVLTDKGVQQFIYEDLNAVQFQDKKIRTEIARALTAVRQNSTQDIRTLNVEMKGKGNRQVTMAYVVEAPLWKSSYRLVLPEDGKQGFIQGWAVVENMTGSDWDNVDLTLISGNPVTFRQALYQSYHVQRPEIPVEVFGRVMPRVDTGSMAMADGTAVAHDGAQGFSARKEARRSRLMKAEADMAGNNFSSLAAAPMAMEMAEEIPQPTGMGMVAQMANASQSAEATSQVLFTFGDKFNLGAGQSMMVPFISQKLPVERLSLYQPDTHATHPLAAVRLKNTGQSGMPPGILTLYEENKALNGTGFVGDAQLPVLGKGEDRLVSYALDSKTKIDRLSKNNQREDKITIAKGIMRTAVKYRSETEYTVTAPAEEGRTIMIEQPKMHGYELVSPDPKQVEVTKTHYRIKMPIKAGEVKKQTVTLEKDGMQSIHIGRLSYGDLKAYATTRGKLDPKTRKAFEDMAQLKSAMDTVQQQLNHLENERRSIYNDQERLRENIKSLSGKSDIRDRYLERLDDQEDRLEDIEERKADLQRDLKKRTAELEKYIMSLKI